MKTRSLISKRMLHFIPKYDFHHIYLQCSVSVSVTQNETMKCWCIQQLQAIFLWAALSYGSEKHLFVFLHEFIDSLHFVKIADFSDWTFNCVIFVIKRFWNQLIIWNWLFELESWLNFTTPKLEIRLCFVLTAQHSFFQFCELKISRHSKAMGQSRK